MPENINQLVWYVATGLTVGLIGIIAVLLRWGFVLLTDKLQHMSDKFDAWVVRTARMEEKLDGHINNRSIHKGD